MKNRIIIKVGTKVLSTKEGRLDGVLIKHLTAQISKIKNKGYEVILVTSGAMGSGRSLIKPRKDSPVVEKQVLAAVGQVKLMSTYFDAFARHHLVCAQVLVTKEDFRDKKHYLNMKNCFENLLRSGAVPVVNENDVVATSELLFTDNDELTGLIASQLKAPKVIFLTSVDGFLISEKRKNNVVREIEFKDIGLYKKYISSSKTGAGRGGMTSKFIVSRKLVLKGTTVWIANGKRKNILIDILSGKNTGTKFIPRKK
jgi:glutamate 5-kinase